MEELGMQNLLSEAEIDSLFSDEDITEETQETSPDKKEENAETTEELDTDSLFEETPESVGSEEHQEGEDTTSTKETGSSPTKNNFYSSIAKALKEEGVLPDLDDETAGNIKEPEDLARAIEDQIQARFDEKSPPKIEAPE